MIRAITLREVCDFILINAPQISVSLEQGDCSFMAVSTDTRSLQTGELFVALRGENFDAHNFLNQALEKNPCALVVEKFYPELNVAQLVVSDSLLALGQIAAFNRSLFTGPLIAITGSSGKTTVKTLVAFILAEMGSTLATKGNFNNHIGVPLTLLQLEAQHQFAVIEMGASGPGEIAYLCELAKPQVTMINNVMPAHIAGFGSIEGVARAKGEIYGALAPAATAVVNIDDVFAPQWLAQLSQQPCIRVSLHGQEADCFAKNIMTQDATLDFDLVIKGQSLHVHLNAQGDHSVRNALMAAACATAVGANLQQIQAGLAKFIPVAGRMNSQRGYEQALIIDDSYNANPGSVRAAIDVLSQAEQSVLVLGDLGELGDDAVRLHAELGSYARSKNIKKLFTLGFLSENATQTFGANAAHFYQRDALIAALKAVANSQTTFLIKGSRSAKMELVVRELCDLAGDTH